MQSVLRGKTLTFSFKSYGDRSRAYNSHDQPLLDRIDRDKDAPSYTRDRADGRKGSSSSSRIQAASPPTGRRSNETGNPSANGMQSNPFAESDLALVNPNRGKSARNNAGPARSTTAKLSHESPIFGRLRIVAAPGERRATMPGRMPVTRYSDSR